MSKQIYLGEISQEEVEAIETTTRKLSSLIDVKATMDDTTFPFDKGLIAKIEDEIAAARKEKDEWWERYNREKGWAAEYIDFETRRVYG